jgi:hypothetical protein
MFPISSAFTEAIKGDFRKIHAKVTIDFSPTLKMDFLDNDIFSIRYTTIKTPSPNRLPYGQIATNKLELKLYNKNRIFDPQNTNSPLYGKVKPNCKIQCYLGAELPDLTTEWVPLGTFWSGDWNVPEDEPWVATTAKDRLNLLERSLYQTGSVINTPAVIVHVDDSQSDWSQGILSNVTATTSGELILNISGVN